MDLKTYAMTAMILGTMFWVSSIILEHVANKADLAKYTDAAGWVSYGVGIVYAIAAQGYLD